MSGADRKKNPSSAPCAPAIRRVMMTGDAVGGVWPYMLDLASALRTRGIDVTIAVMGPEPTAAQRAAAQQVGTLESRAYRLEWMDAPWDDVQRAGEWLLEVESRVGPDIVHLNGYCHAALSWRVPAVVVAHSCVCSWWRSVHDADAPAQYDRYRLEVSRGLERAGLVIAPTMAMRDALRREYPVLPEVRVIPNGRSCADAATGEPSRANAGPPAKEQIVFAAGRLWDEAKNIQSLCGVAASLPWPVYVSGSDACPDGRCVETGNARYLGRLEAGEMHNWFARAAIYALPARYEPFGLSVLEAAAAGCALVLGDIPSLRENWSGAAVFVPPDNRRALAGALRRLTDDPAECSRLGALARQRAQRFDLSTAAELYLAAYRDALGSDPAFPSSVSPGSRGADLAFPNEPVLASETRDLTPVQCRRYDRGQTPVPTS